MLDSTVDQRVLGLEIPESEWMEKVKDWRVRSERFLTLKTRVIDLGFNGYDLKTDGLHPRPLKPKSQEAIGIINEFLGELFVTIFGDGVPQFIKESFMTHTPKLQLCTSCGNATGRTGSEDSLHIEECGPFCEECHKRVLEAITPTSSPQPRLRVIYDDDLLAEQLYLESITNAELYPKYFDLPAKCKIAWRGKAKDVLEHYKQFYKAEILVS